MPSLFLRAFVFLSVVQFLSSSAIGACRDSDMARGLGSLAYAAQPEATIQYFGHNFFLITTRKGTHIVTDPLGPGRYPYPSPEIAGDVITVGREHYNHNYIELVQGTPVVLRGLKEYGTEWNRVSMSFRDVFIYNVPIYHYSGSAGSIKGAAFVFDLGVLCIAHLGDLSQKLTEEQLKQIGKVDIALTPIGGRRTMSPGLAREVLGQLKPKIAIPMHYRDNLDRIREFTAGLKAQVLDTDTLVVSKNALPSSLEIRVLQPEGSTFWE